ncbi:TonB-dependent receptor domain-containing protein [Pedobacter nyackensis]|uniref:Outer membrane receptor proteins, mostly Fe transport n=1 Tax=Pedobacter nyackensis TaxID=475255 RepID=A0A1W2BGG8_9SPHI|nr:TonB-dependent receptor [Pedobacter nyackensis]SMC71842.1 Outer membrane receptor proteins, mostly Fe transport [Pedobacter nyackensis]
MTNFYYKVLLLTLIICITTVKINAQTTNDGKITAKVTDAQNNETIPFASAIVIDRKTKAVVKGIQADVNGNLAITGLPNGVFTFKVSYVGYQTMVRDSVSISAAQNAINLGTVKMKPAKGTALKEVAITAQKSTMQLGIDKKVFSVDQSLVSEGGSASDLLQNVPSIQTDVDGNVSLRGSTGVKVLIDGKPSLIAGGDIAQILQSIPASSIESVEVITNPSAKYDAEGQSGIINIVLKRNKKLGLNGNVGLTAGNRDNYNGNASISFQNNKVNLYGNYGYRYGNRPGGGFNNITYKKPNSITNLTFADQTMESAGLDKSHNAKAGIDYYLTAKDILSLSGGFNSRNQTESDLAMIYEYGPQRNPLEFSTRNTSNSGSGNSYDLNFDYSHKFKTQGEELTFNFGYSTGNNDRFQDYSTSVYDRGGIPVSEETELLRNINNGNNSNYNIQTDYTLPLGKLGKMEAGYRSQIRYSDNNSQATEFNSSTGMYDANYALSNLFDSKDQVHALYLNYQNQYKNFGYQIGFRGEDALLNTNSGGYDNDGNISYTPGKISYQRLYPSIYLTQKFKGEQQLQGSYSRRVNRPRAWDTNPFTDYSNRFNWRRGNPNLLPEDVHSFELSYSKFWPKVTLISTAYMRRTNDLIQRVRSSANDEGVIITTPQNLTRELSSGFEFISKVDVLKAWNFTTNVNVYHSDIAAVPAYNIRGNSGFSWNANVTNNFVLPYSITLQVKGEYESDEVMAQGKRNANWSADAGAKYDFPGKKASLSFNVRDVFNTRKWSMEFDDDNTKTEFQRRRYGPVGNLTFSYRFGKTTFQKKSKKSDQEMRSDEESF